MVKGASVIIAGCALVTTILMSWSHFYAEQRVNTVKIQSLEDDKAQLSEVVYAMNNNQAKLIETVSNQGTKTKELRSDFKVLLKVVTDNQVVLAKILVKVEE